MKDKKALIAQISSALTDPTTPARPTTSLPKANTHATREKAAKVQAAIPAQAAAPQDDQTSRPTGSGKQAAFWLDDEDRAIFHETGMLLYSQGIKPSHNLVLRAAIRMIPRDHRLVEKVRELIEKDGRKVRHQKK